MTTELLFDVHVLDACLCFLNFSEFLPNVNLMFLVDMLLIKKTVGHQPSLIATWKLEYTLEENAFFSDCHFEIRAFLGG